MSQRIITSLPVPPSPPSPPLDPRLETIARIHALRMADGRPFEVRLREARELVRHAVSA